MCPFWPLTHHDLVFSFSPCPCRPQLEDLANSKADRITVETELNNKANKEDVARDTERNLRAVDEALGVMNAGTQGVQQLLERQEELCQQLAQDVNERATRDDLKHLHNMVIANAPLSEEERRQMSESEVAKVRRGGSA